jgi:hypothetical protein
LGYDGVMNVHHPAPDTPPEEVDLFEMANLYPRDTGLPMTVWVSPKGRARHDARVKVCRTHGNRMDADDVATVSIRPEPELMHGPLPTADLKPVQAWIRLNATALIGYWEGDLSTVEFVRALKTL